MEADNLETKAKEFTAEALRLLEQAERTADTAKRFFFIPGGFSEKKMAKAREYLQMASEIIATVDLLRQKDIAFSRETASKSAPNTILSNPNFASESIRDAALVEELFQTEIQPNERNQALDYEKALAYLTYILRRSEVRHEQEGVNRTIKEFEQLPDDLVGTNLAGRNLTGVSFRGKKMTGANLERAILVKADLAETDLQRATLAGAVLIIANMNRANLSSADLRNANLHFANLSFASLQNASLQGADLTGASLTEANLTGAKMSNADLTGVNLKGAKVTQQQLASAKSLKGAIMPDGSDYTAENYVYEGRRQD